VCRAVDATYSCDPENFEWIEPIPGWSYCEARGTSDDGEVVVGHCAKTPEQTVRGFRWTRAEGMQSLVTKGARDFASSVSGNGKMVLGSYYDDEENRHWYLWTATGGMQYPQGLDDARAINFDGSVVVGSIGDLEGATRAARWTERDGAVDLGATSVVGTINYATAVSADGKVVAGSGIQAWRWTAQSGVVALPDPDAMHFVSDMSSDGSLVVGYGFNALVDPDTDFGLLWVSGESKVHVLPKLGDGSKQVSDSGVIVSGEYVWDGELLWTDDALERVGVRLPEEATWFSVYDITPDGKTWVGAGGEGEVAVAFVARAK
jgi:hypothetical protein